MLWPEFKACLALGLDPDEYFKKDKFSRMMITGGIIANNAIDNMRQHDIHEERERNAKRNK